MGHIEKYKCYCSFTVLDFLSLIINTLHNIVCYCGIGASAKEIASQNAVFCFNLMLSMSVDRQ